MVLLDIVGVIVVVGLIWAVVQTIKTWRANRVPDKESILLLRQKYQIASAGLRAVANGAGNPILEATVALDKIEQLEIKELSS